MSETTGRKLTEEQKARRRAQYALNPEKARRVARAQYALNPQAVNERARKSVARNPTWTKFRAKRSKARLTGVPFTIKYEEIVWPSTCPALGLPLDYQIGVKGGGMVRGPLRASFDRLDSDLGYVSGNVAIISQRANTIKGDATVEELRAVADWLEAALKRSTNGCIP